MDVRFAAEPSEETLDLQQMVDEGVRRAYLDPTTSSAPLCKPTSRQRINTKDNTPAVVNWNW